MDSVDIELTDLYFADRCEDGVVRLLTMDYAFEVADAENLLESLPTFVRATLIPADEGVGYEGAFAEVTVEAGDAMVGFAQESLADAVREGRIVKTADEFCKIVPELKADLYGDGEIEVYQNGTKLTTPTQPKIGRNDPCPCGSGKKYKKCCGK